MATRKTLTYKLLEEQAHRRRRNRLLILAAAIVAIGAFIIVLGVQEAKDATTKTKEYICSAGKVPDQNPTCDPVEGR